MGIKRGNFENVGLGALAKSANPNYHQQASVATGLGALAQGVKAYAAGWDAIADGLRVWGDIYTDLGKKAVEADKQQKYNEQMASNAENSLRQKMVEKGITEDDPRMWTDPEVIEMRDDVMRWKDRARHQSIFGVFSSPQPTREYRFELERAGATDEQVNEFLDKRRSALSPTDKNGNKLGRGDRSEAYGFGGIQSWDAEEW